MGTNLDTQLVEANEDDAALMDSFKQTVAKIKERQCEHKERIKSWIDELPARLKLPEDFEPNITALINKIGRDTDKSPIATIGWDLVEKWKNLNLIVAKSDQKELTDIKSMLGNGAKIEIKTNNGVIVKISIRQTTTRHIDSLIIIGWFVTLLSESQYRDRFLDDSKSECSEMIFSAGEIYDYLCETLKSTVSDFGAGSKENKGAVKNIVLALKPLYEYIRNSAVPDAGGQTIKLLALEDILRSDDFVTYIEKRSKYAN